MNVRKIHMNGLIKLALVIIYAVFVFDDLRIKVNHF